MHVSESMYGVLWNKYWLLLLVLWLKLRLPRWSPECSIFPRLCLGKKECSVVFNHSTWNRQYLYTMLYTCIHTCILVPTHLIYCRLDTSCVPQNYKMPSFDETKSRKIKKLMSEYNHVNLVSSYSFIIQSNDKDLLGCYKKQIINVLHSCLIEWNIPSFNSRKYFHHFAHKHLLFLYYSTKK